MDAFSVRFAPDMTAGMEVAGRSGGEAIALCKYMKYLVTLVTPPKNLTLRFPAYNTGLPVSIHYCPSDPKKQDELFHPTHHPHILNTGDV